MNRKEYLRKVWPAAIAEAARSAGETYNWAIEEKPSTQPQPTRPQFNVAGGVRELRVASLREAVLGSNPSRAAESARSSVSVASAALPTRRVMTKAEFIDRKWIDENEELLSRAFPNRWVAVLDRQVVGSDRDGHTLALSMESEYPGRRVIYFSTQRWTDVSADIIEAG